MNDLERVATRLATARHSVVFTGAGISTSSGIPDFRSPGGLWTRFDPAVHASYQRFLDDPALYWTMAKETTPVILSAKPNPVHVAIAELERMEIVEAVIT